LKSNQIIQGDCIDLLKSVPDDFVDMSFADPPFNLNKKYGSSSDDLKTEDYLKWCEEWITEMVRVTKPTGSIFIHNIPKWSTCYANILNKTAHFKHWITWKTMSGPAFGKTLQPSHYPILFYIKELKNNKFNSIRYPHQRCRKCSILSKDYGGKKHILHPFGPTVSDVWTDIYRVRHKKKRDKHPCQLPLHLLERIILMTTDEGDLVLDPFMGTGTTALSAKRLGRKYLGFDLDEDYVNIANQKLSEENFESKVGNSWVSFHLKDIVTIRDKDWEDISTYFRIPEDRKRIDKEKITYLKNIEDDIFNMYLS
jgi:site-specific DNA-methyltransferase (adenine-specific)